MVMKISFVVVVMSIALCSLAEDHPQEISGINLDLLHEDTTGSCTIKGQIFQKCARCPATCSEPNLICTKQCTSGCGCPTGELIDTVNKKCVKPYQCHHLSSKRAAVLCDAPNCVRGLTAVPPGEYCPVCVCQAGGKTFFPGESFQEDCNTCTCTSSGLAVCTKRACQIGKYRRQGERDGSCSIEGQVFTTCGTACPPTCSEPGPVPCTNNCIVGCQCPSGTVLDKVQKKCVKPDQCASLPW